MRQYLYILTFLLLSLSTQAQQCNFNVFPAEVCAGEPITAYILNVNPNFEYKFRFLIGGNLIDEIEGDSVVFYPGGSLVDQVVTVRPFSRNTNNPGNFSQCNVVPKTAIVKASPDPTLDFLTGTENEDGIIANCDANSTSDFELTVGNGSSTVLVNTFYEIDWGDGTPGFSGATFTTSQSHTYPPGNYTLTFTVTGTGTPNCSPATYEYTIFNGSIPTVGINPPADVLQLCPPADLIFDIIDVTNNVEGTIYEIFISGEQVLEFEHLPPSSFVWTFEETSCGQTTSNGIPNAYDITIQASNPCPFPPAFETIGPITIGSPVLPDFTVNPDPVCINDVITFTNETIGTLDAIACDNIEDAVWTIEPATGWTLINGDMDGDSEIQVLFDDPSEYEVNMEVMNSCDTADITKTLQVGVAPFADAIAVLDNIDACVISTATFTNLSTQDSVSYLWEVNPMSGVTFINGTSATDFEPEIRFSEAGTFNVTLTVSNECGSPQWDTVFTINDVPNLEIIPPIGNQCIDTFIFESNLAFEPDAFNINWIFNGGNPATWSGPNPPPIVFVGTGNYFIQVSAENICGTSSFTESFQLSDPIVIDIGPNLTVCDNDAPFTLTANPSGGAWSGEGVNGNIFDPGQTTNDTIELTYSYDNNICIAIETKEVYVIRLDSISAGEDETVCLSESAYMLAGNYPEGGYWQGNGIIDQIQGVFDPLQGNIGSNIIAYLYQDSIYNCLDTAYKEIIILDIPLVEIIAADTMCLNVSNVFEAQVEANVTVNWDFGDNSSDNGTSVAHIYDSLGLFWVYAFITDSVGCVSSDSTLIRVIDGPIPSYTIDVDFGCNLLSSNFTNTSTGQIDSFYWDFGNGITSNQENPQNISFGPGLYYDTTYVIELTIYNQCGGLSHFDTVSVSKAPVARFGTNISEVCPGQEVLINNASFNSPESFFWDFGNGQTSTDEIPPSLFFPTPTQDTIYIITLIAYNQCGSDTFSNSLLMKTVNVQSFFNASPLIGCEPLQVTFTSFSSIGANVIWDFDDGNTAIIDTVMHEFINDGIYNVSLVVDNGCSRDTSGIEITVLARPIVTFTYPDIGCLGQPITFTNTSPDVIGFQWDFGDGNNSILTNPTVTYQNTGTFPISLIGENSNGCADTTTASIDIIQNPLADFDVFPNVSCANFGISFINLSQNANDFYWDFGDGTFSIQEDPVKVYPDPGTYDIMLVSSNDNACFDTLIQNQILEIYPSPDADFTYIQTENGLDIGEIEFTNISEDATIYFWDFGDGLNSSEMSPTHQYLNSGSVTVLMVAENEFGCIDSIIKVIDIGFFGNLFVPNAFSPIIGSQSDASLFLPKGIGLVSYEMEIYSSYGELLWRTTELSNGQPVEGWNGQFNGKNLPADVYVWKIKATLDNGSVWQGMDYGDGEKTTIGSLVLIR